MQLQDKTLVITGASGGIGQALAAQLAAAGARLLLTGRDEEKLMQLVAELPGGAGQHLVLEANLQEQAGVEDLCSFCQELPSGIQGLVNNAGVCDFGLLQDMSNTEISATVLLNLAVPMILTSRLLPLLLQEKEGLLLNIGSVLGAIGHPGFDVYSASKAGLERFSESLQRELADSNVHVMHFNPRATHTSMNSPAVIAMNLAMGVKSDEPAAVADVIIRRIKANQFSRASMGWPEKLFVRVNALLPTIVDKSSNRKLELIKRYATAE